MPRPPMDDRDRFVSVEFELHEGYYRHNGVIKSARTREASLTVSGPVSAVGAVLFVLEGCPEENRPVILEEGQLQGLCSRHLRHSEKCEVYGSVCPGCVAEMRRGTVASSPDYEETDNAPVELYPVSEG